MIYNQSHNTLFVVFDDYDRNLIFFNESFVLLIVIII